MGRDTKDDGLSKAERKAAEKAEKAARKAAEQAEKQAKKAAEDAEKADKGAEKPKKDKKDKKDKKEKGDKKDKKDKGGKKAKKAEKAARSGAGEPMAERSGRRLAKHEQHEQREEQRRATREPGAELPFEGGKRKGKKAERGGRDAGDAAPMAVELADGSIIDLSEVEDAAAPVADFSGLAKAMPRILELLEPLDPEVRRSAFDSYVTGVTVHGLAAEDLPVLELRAGGPVEAPAAEARAADEAPATATATASDEPRDAPAEQEPAAGPRRAGFEATAPEPRTGPVREAEGYVREESGPKSAVTAASRGRTGMRLEEPAAGEATAAPKRRRGAPSITAPAKRAPGKPAATKPMSTAPASASKAADGPEQLPPSERIRRAGAAAGAAKRATSSTPRRRTAAATPAEGATTAPATAGRSTAKPAAKPAAKAAAKPAAKSTASSAKAPARASSAATPSTPARRSTGAPKALMDRVAAKSPRNNDQRTAIIVAHLEQGRKPVDETAIAAMYEKLAWRVPVNMGTSLRQAVRSGFLDAGELGTVSLGEAGRAWLES